MYYIQLQESNDVLKQFHVMIALTLHRNGHEAVRTQTWPKCQWLRYTVHHAWKCVWESVK